MNSKHVAQCDSDTVFGPKTVYLFLIQYNQHINNKIIDESNLI